MAQLFMNSTSMLRMSDQSLASLGGLGTQRCCEPWCRSQKWPGSRVAVAVAQAGGCGSSLTLSLGTSICLGCCPKKIKKINKVFMIVCYKEKYYNGCILLCCL